MPAEKYEDCSFYQIKNRDLPGTAKCNGGEGMPDECKIRETCPFYQAFKAQGPWWENIPVNPERDEKILEQLKRMDAEEERMKKEMMGKPIELKKEPEGPMTAEERMEKFPMIPSRVETKNGTWEIIDGYQADETLVGYRAKKPREGGPLGEKYASIILTVEEWYKLFAELEPAIAMMML